MLNISRIFPDVMEHGFIRGCEGNLTRRVNIQNVVRQTCILQPPLLLSWDGYN